MTRQDLRRQGEVMLKTLFGSSAQPPGLSHLLTETSYGGIWFRPGLSILDRLICAIATPSTTPRLRAPHHHIGAGEVTIQTSPYTGFPPALNALDALSGAFA